MEKEKQFQIVLIDDDSLVIEIWSEIAKDYGHNLIAFDDYEILFKSLYDLNQSDLLFCDFKNKEEYIGIEASKKLYDLGFKNLYLQTGDEDFARSMEAPWLLGILGKAYPKEIIEKVLKERKNEDD